MRRRLWRSVALFTLVVVVAGCEEEPEPRFGDACSSLADCIEGFRLVCEAGSCARIDCLRTVQCPIDAACVGGFCDQPQCEVSDDCASGFECFEGACRNDLCRTKDGCGIDQICRANQPRICIDPPEFCLSDRDCPGIFRCSLPSGSCVPPCEADTDCARDRYCDPQGICRAECADSRACPGDQVCARRRCVESDCPSGGCEAARPKRDPESCACVECLNDLDCSREGEQCIDSGSCTYCPWRGTRAECQQAGLIFNQGCCSECIDDVDCAIGLSCERGRCRVGDPRECEAGECGAGEVCDNGTCRPSGSLTDCVTQADCPTGEACYGDRQCRTEAPQCSDCPAPSRCIAEIGDSRGVCAGCMTSCAPSGCPEGQLCVKADGASEGFCEETLFSGCP